MTHIARLLLLLPLTLEAGPKSSPPGAIKHLVMSVHLINEKTQEDFFIKMSQYTVDDALRPTLYKEKGYLMNADNPGKSDPTENGEDNQNYTYSAEVKLGICPTTRNAALQYALSKRKENDEPVILHQAQSIVLPLHAQSKIQHEERFQERGYDAFLLRIEIYPSSEYLH